MGNGCLSIKTVHLPEKNIINLKNINSINKFYIDRLNDNEVKYYIDDKVILIPYNAEELYK